MKKICVAFILVLGVLSGLAWAEDLPDNMQEIQVTDGYKMIVPKGAKVEKVGAQIKVQDQGEFLFDRVVALEKQFLEVKKDQDQFNQRMEDVRKETATILRKLNGFLDEIKDNQGALEEEIESLAIDVDDLKEGQALLRSLVENIDKMQNKTVDADAAEKKKEVKKESTK